MPMTAVRREGLRGWDASDTEERGLGSWNSVNVESCGALEVLSGRIIWASILGGPGPGERDLGEPLGGPLGAGGI
eukprot:2166538-Pyramimonas_sp.AAC.1